MRLNIPLMPKFSKVPHLIDGVWHFATEEDLKKFQAYQTEVADFKKHQDSEAE
jgi:hypothetical protein